jgi:hypothetical protein
MANLPVYDYKKIKKEDIHAFMVENATAEEKADFKAKAFETKKQKTRVPVYIPGTTEPVIVRRKDKKTGQYKLMPKMEMVEVEETTAKPTYNHRKAVAWFVAKYDGKKITVVNKPEKKSSSEEKKPSAVDLFADF